MEQRGPPEPVQPREDGAQTGGDSRGPARQLQGTAWPAQLGDSGQDEGRHTLMWSAVSVLNLETPAWDFALQLPGPSWEASPSPGLHARAHATERIPRQPQLEDILPGQ